MPPRLPLSRSLLRRPFHTLPRLRAEAEASEDLSDMSELNVSTAWEDRKDVKDMLQWVQRDGQKYKRPSAQGGPNYVQRTKFGAKKEEMETEDILEKETEVESVNGKELAESEFVQKLNTSKGFGMRRAAKPFKDNPFFVSQSVLSEMGKEAIYNSVMVKGNTVKQASEHFKVTTERVAAVVRMKQIERDWVKEGKRVVPRYNEQVLRMLPQTPYSARNIQAHESINDLPVHPATTRQIFWPVSESRQFTRDDAGTVFRDGLKPADLRIPHPEMVVASQIEGETSRSMRMRKELERAKERIEKEKLREDKKDSTMMVDRGRWRFEIEDVDVDAVVGEGGRGRKGVGWRYGMPFDDRKRAVVKIPTSVA